MYMEHNISAVIFTLDLKMENLPGIYTINILTWKHYPFMEG